MKRYVSEAEPDFETSCFIKKQTVDKVQKNKIMSFESYTIFRAV